MKIVLTGGPAAGKTSVVETLYRNSRDRIIVCPEAASILFSGGFPRLKTPDQVKCQQRAIYHVQKELEEISFLEANGRAVVCDRGSLDGLAYWPSDGESFFAAVSSSMQKEIERYDWVIHLDTAAKENYQNNPVRSETELEAQEVNERVKHHWSLHPRRLIIPNSADFIAKLQLAVWIVDLILEGHPLDEIQTKIRTALK